MVINWNPETNSYSLNPQEALTDAMAWIAEQEAKIQGEQIQGANVENPTPAPELVVSTPTRVLFDTNSAELNKFTKQRISDAVQEALANGTKLFLGASHANGEDDGNQNSRLYAMKAYAIKMGMPEEDIIDVLFGDLLEQVNLGKKSLPKAQGLVGTV
jgi:outer membrane protein OmpA-like peptidoglycan-associated protein